MLMHWMSSLLSRLSRYLTFLFVSTDNCEENCFVINFKCSNGENIKIPVDITFTIREAKEEIVRRSSIGSIDCIKIIFAGRELPNETTFGDCDLVNGSILHIIQVECSPSQSSAAKESSPTDEKYSATNAEDDDDTLVPVARYLTVYCKSCQSIQAGRMRVRCVDCKESAVILDRDPQSWKDVLTPNAITAKCHNLNGPCCDKASVNVEFFFKCSAKSCDSASCVPLDQVKHNSYNSPCLSCRESTEKIFSFNCLSKSRHCLCLECFSIYSTSRLNERQFTFYEDIGYTLQCPLNCDNSFIKETNHFRLLDKQLYSKYERFAEEAKTLAVGAVFCPNSKCSQLIMVEENTDQCIQVICPKCTLTFASKCRCEPHTGNCSGDPSDKFSLACKLSHDELDEIASYKEIFRISKPCPGCKTPTERDSGCMHMSCTMADCRFEWCWLCEAEWSRNCMTWHWFDE